MTGMNTQHIELDISKPDALTQTVTIGQGDKGGTTIVATVYDNGALADLDGMDARFECRLPDGHSYVRDTNCTVSGSEITYVVDEEHVASVAGATDEAYFDILDGTTVVYSTNRFRLKVLRSAHDGAQPAESWDSAVDDLIERGEAAIEEITEAFVPVSHGGTGATNATDALVNLGALGTRSTQGPAYGPLLSVTANGHAEQDGTPTPSDPKEIVVVRGRNLLPNNATSQTVNGVTFTVNADGTVTADGTATANTVLPLELNNAAGIKPDTTYVISGCPSGGSGTTYMLRVTDNLTLSYDETGNAKTFSYANVDALAVSIRIINGTTVRNLTFRPQLELGSTAHPYVPYGHVGLDVTADGTTTTTPIPLPSRGWVGSLPDGTHDALSIDGAGKVTWELADEEVTFDGSSDEAWSQRNSFAQISVNGLKTSANEGRISNLRSSHFIPITPVQAWNGTADGVAQVNEPYLRFVSTGKTTDLTVWKAWLQSNPVTVLYPLATHTTESMGYVDLPDIPEGAVVSMPELEGLGVESWTSDAVARYVRAWAARS